MKGNSLAHDIEALRRFWSCPDAIRGARSSRKSEPRAAMTQIPGDNQDVDPTIKERFAANYLYAKKALGLSDEAALKFARTEAMRDRFFWEAYRLPHNRSLRLLYGVPPTIVVALLLLGFVVETRWYFYAPALIATALWANARKWSSFWVPLLWWFRPLIPRTEGTPGDLDPTDWRTYFFLPPGHGRANLPMMVMACHEDVRCFGFRYLATATLSIHVLYLGLFGGLAYFAWR